MTTLGERAADRVARVVGSWRFIIFQSCFLSAWIVINAYVALHEFHFNGWDPYPFVFLNLMLSFQAAYTGPILQMTGNRRDQLEAERTAQTLSTMLATMQGVHAIAEAIKHEMQEQDEILEEIHDEVHRDLADHEVAWHDSVEEPGDKE